jgi:hypothetical protein
MLTTAIVRLTDNGVVMPRELASAARPMVGVIHSMAWEFTGDRLRIVWFNYTDKLHYDLEHAVPIATRPFMSYAQTKGYRAARARERRSARAEAP